MRDEQFTVCVGGGIDVAWFIDGVRVAVTLYEAMNQLYVHGISLVGATPKRRPTWSFLGVRANSRTIQLYKDTLEFAASDELLVDTSSNLEQYMQTEIARAMAVSANSYVLLGTGSSQPYGLNARVSNSVPLSASAITNAQVVAVSTAVNGSYLQNGQTGWVMRNATWGALRTLDLTNYHPLSAIENGSRPGC